MVRWLSARLPTREKFLANRWIRPFANRLTHPLLWHLNRRSLARGVALGLLVGFIVPLGQTPAAAFLALTARAHILIAAAATLITNPFTFPAIYFAAYKIGARLLDGRIDAAEDFGALRTFMFGFAAPTAVGLIVFGLAAALLSYQLVQWGWRWRVTRRWRDRARRRAA